MADATNTRAQSVSKGALWTGRIMSAVPVFMLLMSAVMKLAKAAPVVEGFAHFGWPEGAPQIIGIIELACTFIYLIPRTQVLGAILLTGYLGGAVATHARLGEIQLLGALSFGVLVWGGLFFRDPRIRALIPLRS